MTREGASLGAVVRPGEARVQRSGLVLYHYPSCPFCLLVRQAASRLGLNLELRDIHREPEALRSLTRVTGRSTVPVLLLVCPAAEPQWLPESRAIVDYLKRAASGASVEG